MDAEQAGSQGSIPVGHFQGGFNGGAFGIHQLLFQGSRNVCNLTLVQGRRQKSKQTTEQKAGDITQPVTQPVAPPVKRLLALLAEKGDMGNAEIRRQFGLKDRTHVRNLYVDPAMEAGLIEYTLPDKPNSNLQKYRLTGKGRTWLAAVEEKRGTP
ncbi:MAG: hypothetical protein V2B19_05515 [Pseudomonadota bacterium]